MHSFISLPPIGVLVVLLVFGRMLLSLAMRVVAYSKVREVVTAMALFIVLGMATLLEHAGLSMEL